MRTNLIGTGAALVLAVSAVLTVRPGGAAGGPPEAVDITGDAPEVAPFNENLRRYDISAVVTGATPDPAGLRPDGTPYYRPDDIERADDERIDKVIETIQNLVSYEDWQANGGDAGKIFNVGTMLFVEATPEMHEGVLWVLQSLRQDFERENAAFRRAVEDAEAARLEHESARLTRMEDEHRERVARTQSELAELEAQHKEIVDRLVGLNEQKSLLGFHEKELGSSFGQGKTDDQLYKEIAETRSEIARLELETNLAGAQLARTRALLIDRQFERYGRVTDRAAPTAPTIPTAPPRRPQ